MSKLIYDTVDASKARLTEDGYLVAEARVARTGIQLYGAAELGLDGVNTIRVYRPPEEVFAKDAMSSYAHRPVTVDHPSEMVNGDNWKDHARGQTGDEVLRDGEFVRVPMMLMDKSAIEDWVNGKRELSMGYTMDLEMKDGTTPEGEKFDAVQRNLRMNHLALVTRARGGSKLRLGDFQSEETHMSDVKLTTITVDGLSVETTDAGAQAISKLTQGMADARQTLEDERTTHADALATKDGELATKDAEIDNLKSKQLSDADIDKRVNDRADLIATAKTIADKDYSGLSDADIRKTAVAAKLGQQTIEDKSDDYVQARFDILADDADEDPVRKAIKSGDAGNGDAADKAHSKMVDGMQNAWKGGAE